MTRHEELPDTLAASLAGRYALEREIGRGGMATVYLARDLRHERRVAVKVLHPELAAALGAERFLAEIRTTANLQHPHILPLHDSGEADGHLYYVMPFVEGETLRARLERETQLPIDDAVRIAREVLSALDYAHRHGVVHRDVKPENVLLHDGSALVADFGIALAVTAAGGQRMTQTGLSLGTPSYMAPEQAMGERAIDGRADVYAAGAMLYEMLTGEAPFTGATVQAIVAKVMTERPTPPSTVRDTIPPPVEAAVLKALCKLPADRFATAREFADALDDGRSRLSAGDAGPMHGRLEATRGRKSLRLWQGLAAVALLAALVGITVAIALARGRSAAPPLVVRFPLNVPRSGAVNFAVSPDGARVVYVDAQGATTRLSERRFDDEVPHPIAGTEGGRAVLFSPDGRWIGFVTSVGDRTLKKVPAEGGAPTTIAKLGGLGGVAWGPRDVIVYSPGTASPLWRVDAGGGAPRRLTAPDSASGEAHMMPSFLPDGNSVLFTILRNGEFHLAVASLDGTVTPLGIAGTNPHWVSPSHILYTAPQGALAIVPYDAHRHALTGRPVTLIDDIARRGSSGAAFDLSPAGTLVYARGQLLSRLAFVGPNGVRPLPVEPRAMSHPRLSPDGKRTAVAVTAPDGTSDVWTFDVNIGTPTRLTFDGKSGDPIWSRDGRRIAYTRTSSGLATKDVWQVSADGGGSPELLVGAAGGQWPYSWTPDGRTLVYDEFVGGSPTRVMAMTAGEKPRVLASSPVYLHMYGGVSPDGRWLADQSNESGRWEVYVRPLDGVGRWQVSLNGGTEPVWSRDGHTLYYRGEGHIVEATIVPGPSSVAVSGRAMVVADSFATDNTIGYDVDPGGRGFLVLIAEKEGVHLAVVVNWLDELRRRLAQQGRP